MSRTKEITLPTGVKLTIGGLTVGQAEYATREYSSAKEKEGVRTSVLRLWVLPSLNNPSRKEDSNGILGPIPDPPPFTLEKLLDLEAVNFDALFVEICEFNGLAAQGEVKATT